MFKVLDGATAPTRATKYSAMVDLYANSDVVIGAGETKIVPLGVIIDLDALHDAWFKRFGEEGHSWECFLSSHFLDLQPRSSVRNKGLIFEGVACFEEDTIVKKGVVDLDYPKEIGLILHNPVKHMNFNYIDGTIGQCCFSHSAFEIKKGDKIAQCTIVEHKGYLMGIESKVERSGGFGSTESCDWYCKGTICNNCANRAMRIRKKHKKDGIPLLVDLESYANLIKKMETENVQQSDNARKPNTRL